MGKIKQIREYGDGQGVFRNESETEQVTETFGNRAVTDDGEIQQLSTQADTLLADDARGEKFVMRVFEFSYDPLSVGQVPSKQHIFNSHAEMIRHFLWKDGLEPAFEAEPRVIISKRKRNFRIYVLARARFGQMWNDKATTLQEILPPKK